MKLSELIDQLTTTLSDSGDIEVVKYFVFPSDIIEVIGDDNVIHQNEVMNELQTYIDENMNDELHGRINDILYYVEQGEEVGDIG